MTATDQKTILVIEDDTTLNMMLDDQLGSIGYAVERAHSRAEAAAFLASRSPDLILLDLRLPDCNGFDMLDECTDHCPVIILTAYGTVDKGMQAIRGGAADFLLKPVTFENLELAVRRAFDTVELRRDVHYWQSQAQRRVHSRIVGESAQIRHMRELIDLYADAQSTVLLTGESGVGKELVARALYESGSRADARFVIVDCDPSEENLTASELFGYEQGAFPGAESRHEGMLEVANNGTIFLSDIAEMSPALQSKLLRVVETGMFRRLGGTQDLYTDVLILGATRRDLGELVQQGRFRSELYYRLNAFSIHVPSLKARRDDIRILAKYFLDIRDFHKDIPKTLAPRTIDELEAYDWPGNVRELRNAIERGLIMSGAAPEILPEHIGIGSSRRMRGGEQGKWVSLNFPNEPTMEEVRSAYLRLLLDRYDGNRGQVAAVLGISERNTYRLIGKLAEEDAARKA